MQAFCKKYGPSLAALFLGMFLAILFNQFFPRQSASAIPESAYQRVQRTGTLRCGYREQTGILEKDENGKLNGIAYDYAKILAEQSNLKLEWIPIKLPDEGIDLGFSDLAEGRYDALCGYLNTYNSGHNISTYVTPIFYLPVYAYTTINKKLDGHYNAINTSSVTIAAADDSIYAKLAAASFPQAKMDKLRLDATTDDVLDEVANGAADLAFADVLSGQNYLKTHPGKLRQINGPALRLLPIELILAPNELLFKNTLDNATNELQLSGQLDHLLDKDDRLQNIYRSALPFAESILREDRSVYTPPDDNSE